MASTTPLDELLGDEKSKSAIPIPTRRQNARGTGRDSSRHLTGSRGSRKHQRRAPTRLAFCCCSQTPARMPTRMMQTTTTTTTTTTTLRPRQIPQRPNKPKKIDDAGMPTPTPRVFGSVCHCRLRDGCRSSSALPAAPLARSERLERRQQAFLLRHLSGSGGYHRFHSPTNGSPKSPTLPWRALFGLALHGRRTVQPLCAQTSALPCSVDGGTASSGMVPVGATNVGSIRINFDKALRTKRSHAALPCRHVLGGILLWRQHAAWWPATGSWRRDGRVPVGIHHRPRLEAPSDFGSISSQNKIIKVGEGVWATFVLPRRKSRRRGRLDDKSEQGGASCEHASLLTHPAPYVCRSNTGSVGVRFLETKSLSMSKTPNMRLASLRLWQLPLVICIEIEMVSNASAEIL